MRTRSVNLIVAIIILGHAAAVWATEDSVSTVLDRSFVWAAPATAPPGQQVYIAFRKTVDLAEMPSTARLAIFADTRYLLWVNGKFVERGPCRFDPRRPEYDLHDVRTLLKPGRNVIAVLVHSYAIGSFANWCEQCARMMDHRPGLTAQLDLESPNGKRQYISTDATWRLNAKTRFRPSPGTYSSVPDNIDARLDDGDWTAAEYDDGRWAQAEPVSAAIGGRCIRAASPCYGWWRSTPRRSLNRPAPSCPWN